MTLSLALKRWPRPRRQGLRSQCTHVWAIGDFVPRLKALGIPVDGTGFVVNPPSCGPLLSLSRALKRWGPFRRSGLCPPSAHMWVVADFVPCFEALGTPRMAGFTAHLWASANFLLCFEPFRNLRTVGVM